MRAHVSQFFIPIADAGVAKKIDGVETLDDQRGRLRRLPAEYEQMRRPAVIAHHRGQVVRGFLDAAEFCEGHDNPNVFIASVRDGGIARWGVKYFAPAPKDPPPRGQLRSPIPRLSSPHRRLECSHLLKQLEQG